jgi:hypothetical protein
MEIAIRNRDFMDKDRQRIGMFDRWMIEENRNQRLILID